MTFKQTILPVALATGLLAAGCATRQQVGGAPPPPPVQLESAFPTPTPVPAPVVEVASPTPEPTPVPPLPTPVPTPQRNSYIVQSGDSLWSIAGNRAVQGDSFRWPLLFKANRDQIIDPDLIEPDQDLTWKNYYTTDEINDAEQKAGDTPPYSPHSQPRKMLPLKY
jgi:nucleoid-associated protein YgaU